MSQTSLSNRQPVDRTSAMRQARMRERLGAPVKAHLDPELRIRLERCAGRMGITLADLLRNAIEYYLQGSELRSDQIATQRSQAG